MSTRKWQNALDVIIETESGSTQDRWQRSANEKALDQLRNRVQVKPQAENLSACLKAGTLSTNVHLRAFHNFCLSMSWLPWPLIPKRLWPAVRFQPKRAMTTAEPRQAVQSERNPEFRDFRELCCGLGDSQSDPAPWRAEVIDWNGRVIA